MIVIEGKSDDPVYLEVTEGSAEIKCAKDLWGKNVFDTERTLKERVGRRCSVACIGPASENLVYFANIMNDEHRAAGRTGVGAIMGSKKLKAIVVGGNEKPQPVKQDEFDEVSKEAMNKIKTNPVTGEGLPKYGTAILVNVINNAGILPFKNWQTGVNPEADKISGETLAEKYLIKNKSCWGCAIGCGRVTAVKQGCFQILCSEGPEYESIWALGNSTGVIDLEAIIKANHLCDELGLDTI